MIQNIYEILFVNKNLSGVMKDQSKAIIMVDFIVSLPDILDKKKTKLHILFLKAIGLD